MKLTTIVAYNVIVLLVGIQIAHSSTAPPVGITIPNVLITRCVDGDTVKIQVTFGLTVRLLKDGKFLDSPEKRTPMGKIAWIDLARKAEGKYGTVFFPFSDSLEHMVSFGRAKGEIWLNETPRQSISEWQIRQGNAVVSNE